MAHSNGLIKENLIKLFIEVQIGIRETKIKRVGKAPGASRGWELLLSLGVNCTVLSSFCCYLPLDKLSQGNLLAQLVRDVLIVDVT